MSGWWVALLDSINAQAIATLCAGIGAVGSAVWVTRRQQKIKEQELRLSLLHERRRLIQQFRDFQKHMVKAKDLDDPAVSDFWALVQDAKLYFDSATAKAIEDVFEDVWGYIGAAGAISLYKEDEMFDEARAEIKKRSEIRMKLLEKFPSAIKLMILKARVPHSI